MAEFLQRQVQAIQAATGGAHPKKAREDGCWLAFFILPFAFCILLSPPPSVPIHRAPVESSQMAVTRFELRVLGLPGSCW